MNKILGERNHHEIQKNIISYDEKVNELIVDTFNRETGIPEHSGKTTKRRHRFQTISV